MHLISGPDILNQVDNLGIIGNSKGWSVIAIATIYNNEQSNN